MGGASSKAAQSGARKFPKRGPGAAQPPRQAPSSRPAAEARQQAKASFTKDEAVPSDSIDPETNTVPTEFMSPAFSARLKQMGAAQPNPTYSPSSTASHHGDPQHQSQPAPNYPSASDNATLGVLEARRRLQEKADAELENMGKSTDKGRELLDVGLIRRVLVLRQRGERDAVIEERLHLKPGVVRRLGPPGVVEPCGEQAL